VTPSPKWNKGFNLEPALAGNQGIERAAGILRAIGDAAPDSARLTDIADRTQLPKGTVHRLLSALSDAGLVEPDEGGGFFLGFELWVLASKAASRFGLAETARPSLDRLAEKTADTVFLQCRSGFEAICLERVEGRFPIRTLTLSLGDRRPLGIGAGSLAILAALDDEEVEQAMAVNTDKIARYPGFDAAAIWDLVARTRQQGHALNEGRIVEGMHALGVAIQDQRGRPIGALSVAAIQSRMSVDRRANIVVWLRREAGRLEQRLSRVGPGAGPVGINALAATR
jgi:DNA-binding IclR family transcriptional regulator